MERCSSLFLQHQELGGGVLRKLELQQVGVPGLPQPLKGQLWGERCGHKSWGGPEPQGFLEMQARGGGEVTRVTQPEREEGPRPALQAALPGIHSRAEAPTSEFACQIRFFFSNNFC